MLQLQSQAVINRAIVCAEQRHRGRIDGNPEAGRIFITPVLVRSLLVFVCDVHSPVVRESVLEARAGGQRIRSVIVRVDQRARPGEPPPR